MPCPHRGILVRLPGLAEARSDREIGIEVDEAVIDDLVDPPAIGDTLEAAPPGAAIFANPFDGRAHSRLKRQPLIDRGQFPLGY